MKHDKFSSKFHHIAKVQRIADIKADGNSRFTKIKINCAEPVARSGFTSLLTAKIIEQVDFVIGGYDLAFTVYGKRGVVQFCSFFLTIEPAIKFVW